MKKILFSMAFVAVLASFTSCTEESREPAEQEVANAVYILPTDDALGINPVDYTVGASDKSFTYYLGRENDSNELTVSIVNNSDPIFTFPSTVTFKSGKSIAELTITFSDVPAAGAPISFSIAPENAAIYGLGYTKFEGSLNCLWEDLGKGSIFDQLVIYSWASSYDLQEVQILKSRLENRWRVVSPYANQKQIAAAWDASWLGGKACPYIEFYEYTVDGKTYLKWDKFWYSTLLYGGTSGADIKGYFPSYLSSSLASYDASSLWGDTNVAILNPYWYIDGVGGYGCYPVVVSLPGGPDLNVWLPAHGY